jgi:hypothetical protein
VARRLKHLRLARVRSPALPTLPSPLKGDDSGSEPFNKKNTVRLLADSNLVAKTDGV